MSPSASSGHGFLFLGLVPVACYLRSNHRNSAQVSWREAVSGQEHCQRFAGLEARAVPGVRAPHLLLLGRSGEDARAKGVLDGATAKGLVK